MRSRAAPHWGQLAGASGIAGSGGGRGRPRSFALAALGEDSEQVAQLGLDFARVSDGIGNGGAEKFRESAAGTVLLDGEGIGRDAELLREAGGQGFTRTEQRWFERLEEFRATALRIASAQGGEGLAKDGERPIEVVGGGGRSVVAG